MSYWGMNVGAIESLSQELRSSLGDVDNVRNVADSIVNRLRYIWQGLDSERFIDEWFGIGSPTLRGVCDAMKNLSVQAHNHAQYQRYASQR